jgi:hypothetical protein
MNPTLPSVALNPADLQLPCRSIKMGCMSLSRDVGHLTTIGAWEALSSCYFSQALKTE